MNLVVWIIDDDLVSLYATRYRIEQSEISCKVMDFDNAELGLNAFIERVDEVNELPDIIFLDLVMPKMSGWDFLREIENIVDRPKETDIYILSAFTNTKDREQAKGHPSVQGHFDKPLSKMDMEKVVLSQERDVQ